MKTKSQVQNHVNNGYGSESGSPSPPCSPHKQSKPLHCHRHKHRPNAQALLYSIIGFLLRRHFRVLLLLLPLLYISGMLMWAGTFPIISQPDPLPGSLYRSGELFRNLWPQMQSDNASGIELNKVWKWKYNWRLEDQISCAKNTLKQFGSSSPSGYLIIEANGGLNQQRSSICNAVAVAGLLKAILVIPRFHFHSVWMDPSKFRDIYDEDHFIRTLEGHVTVVRKLPETLMERFDYNISNIPNFRVKAWAPASHYLEVIYPLLHEHGVIQLSPFANRLSMEVPSNIQSLRCLANFEALKFSVPIATLAKQLVDRMRRKSSRTDGKYVSVHLRFEKDMVAFSCCEYDGGETEKKEMESARERGWKGKFSRKGRIIRPGLNRVKGRCPLTPLEVGMMLRGMGFNNSTSIYLAAGEIYQSKRNLAPLLQMFPLLQTKETLATPEELAPFNGYSSRLAALDYSVCLFSEVFVTTQGGNFPHFLMGHRRYMYNGHAKTIKPDKSKMVMLLQEVNISWEVFKYQMKSMLVESDRKGIVLRRTNQSIYLQPSPECMCYRRSINSMLTSQRSHQAVT
ncbi:hypothetical protein AAC387_Pa05g1220 [Persea americana]